MYLLTPPTLEPVTLSEAKLAARVSDSTAFDATVPGLITAARQLAEQITGRQLMAQTWRFELDDWPDDADDTLPIYQATAVAITYWTGSTWATLAGGAYEFAPVGTGTGLAPVLNTSWPLLVTKAVGARVRIDITAGATDSSAVPECVKLYIKALVAHWIESPAAAQERSLAEAPFLRLLLDPARLY